MVLLHQAVGPFYGTMHVHFFSCLESVLGDVTSISFIKQLKQVTPAERDEELAKKITASKDILAKLLEFVQNGEKTSKELVQQLTEGKHLASSLL